MSMPLPRRSRTNQCGTLSDWTFPFLLPHPLVCLPHDVALSQPSHMVTHVCYHFFLFLHLSLQFHMLTQCTILVFAQPTLSCMSFHPCIWNPHCSLPYPLPTDLARPPTLCVHLAFSIPVYLLSLTCILNVKTGICLLDLL